ncbi:tetratricopeptide repeat protein [Thermococcus sp.]
MEEILRAIEEKDTKKVANLLYYKVDDLSDEDLKEALEKAEKLALECRDFELYKLVVYYYHELLETDKIHEFEKIVEKEDNFDAKFNLADLYFLIGEFEKSLDIYRQLLEEETEKGNMENIAKVYYNMGLIHEELQEYEKALELMEKAKELLEELGKEEELFHVRIYSGYIKFEMGEISEAKADLAEVFRQVRNKPSLKAQVHLAYEEIFEEEDNYDGAFQECFYAMLEAKNSEYEDVAFDAFIDVIWQLMVEDNFELIYKNMDMFSKGIPEMGDFFEAIKAIALYKDGKIGLEKASEAVSKVKDRRLLDLLEFLSEAEA